MTNNMFGIKTVPLPVMSADGYQPSPERAAPLITERTRAIALTSPNNPVRCIVRVLAAPSHPYVVQTGAVYSPSLLASFASLAREHNIALILDETYRDFILPGPPHDLFSFPAATPTHAAAPDWHWRSTVVHLYSFSKAYHIPGHRLGAIAAGPELLDAIITVLDCLQICASAPAQHALARPGLLPSLRTFVRAGAAALASRQAVFAGACPSAWKIGAQGAYYAFVRHPFAGRTAQEVCERLTYELGVVALPVEFFAAGADVEGLEPGWESWIRISVANVDEEKIREVCRRMKQATDEWEWNLASDVGN
jgi:aspartate/methionine/tyrosine aminotransferase